MQKNARTTSEIVWPEYFINNTEAYVTVKRFAVYGLRLIKNKNVNCKPITENRELLESKEFLCPDVTTSIKY
jgi:hypothetical protein